MSKKYYRFFGGLLTAQEHWLNKMSEKGGCVIINGCSQRLLSIANEKTEFKGWYGVYS